ncbi:DNA methyltransferase [Sporofaciens musculi]|nr:DNA methyltransferase [Sporofaciens musculi]
MQIQGSDSEMVIQGDCLGVLKQMDRNSVDMIYLDPPFFSQKIQSLKDTQGNEYSFGDTWNSREDYLDYMRVRVYELKRVLKDTGSIFLHCNEKASHYLRIILDDVFGEDNFRSEIIWTYKRWSNSKKGLLPGHQTIFFYSKTNDYKFNIVYTEYSPTTNIDQILQERVRDNRGKTIYKHDNNGEVILSKEKKGVPMSDVWEIPFLNPKAKERVGYPTQKPIELLERIVRISTDAGDTVLDPFCGSGTTIVAAELINRKGIGIDISQDAVEISENRLKNPCKTESRLLKLGIESYKTKNDIDSAILNQLDCDVVQRNRGIDGFLKKYYKNAPVAVKIQKPTESLSEAVNLLKTAGKKKKCSVTILIRTQNDDLIRNINIPSNMVIIDDYKIQLENELKEMSLNVCASIM